MSPHLDWLARVTPLRRVLLAAAERRARRNAQDRLALCHALFDTAERALAEERLSPATRRSLLDRIVGDVLVRRRRPAVACSSSRRACHPPAFLTISPGKACNLRCAHCYADSAPTSERLPWSVLDRLVREARELWGIRFCVLSGGEPLAYSDAGKGVLDLAARHPGSYFLMHTNGTLISDHWANRLAEVGNLSPALSLEGMRTATDSARGHGVFDQVVAAAERLRRARVLFGVLLTATRENAGEILSDELVDLFLGRLGAFYAWVHRYVPIGRAPSLDLMLTPGQQVVLSARARSLVAERRLLIAEFSRSAAASRRVAGRRGIDMHVDSDGAISPSVNDAAANINDIYATGGDLTDVWGAAC